MKKPRLTIPSANKLVNVKFGASASSKSPSPLLPKKSYSKAKPPDEFISNANFGQTGLTGRS